MVLRLRMSLYFGNMGRPSNSRRGLKIYIYIYIYIYFSKGFQLHSLLLLNLHPPWNSGSLPLDSSHRSGGDHLPEVLAQPPQEFPWERVSDSPIISYFFQGNNNTKLWSSLKFFSYISPNILLLKSLILCLLENCN